MYIGIAGNIGSGKTTLTEMLAEHYQWEPRYEKVVDNPYMNDYYKNLHRWSFALEVFFLKERFKDVLQISESENNIIQDRPFMKESSYLPPTITRRATSATATSRLTWSFTRLWWRR